MILLLLVGSALHAAAVPKTSPVFVLELGPRIGNLSGQTLHEDNRFYAQGGLQVAGPDGTSSPPDLGATALGLDAGAYLQLRPDAQVGLAFLAQTLWTQPSQTTASGDRATLLTEEDFVLRGAWQPWVFGPVRAGAEIGAGPSFATLHRYGLAARNLLTRVDTLPAPSASPQEMATWTRIGHQPLDLLGLRTEFALKATGDLSPRFGIDARFGAHWTHWSVVGTDPLPRAGWDYPSDLTGWGIDFAVDLFGRF